MSIFRGNFKFLGDESDPLFLNTVAIFITYILIVALFIKQGLGLSDAELSWSSLLNRFIDAIVPSTVTYVLITAVQNTTLAKRNQGHFSLSIWAIAISFIYVVVYVAFLPGNTVSNVILLLTTCLLVILTANSIREVLESEQAGVRSMGKGESAGSIV